MVVEFSKLDLRERPVIELQNNNDETVGTLGYAMNVTIDIKFNEASVLEFDLPISVDGELVPHYKSVVGMRVVKIGDIGRFVLMNPSETGDGIKTVKHCKGYSLEYEFTYKKLSLPKSTYNFYNPVTPDSTLLGLIMEYMPSWGVGHVDEGLTGKYRTFEIDNENIYNFIKGTVQNSYNCIFTFDTMNRKVNVIDANSLVPSNPVYISNENLAKEISVEEETESIVTRLDVNGADGVNIRDVNPMGTNYIVNLDYFMTPDNFNSELIEKYYSWKELFQSRQLPYYNLTLDYALQIMRKVTAETQKTELVGERTVLENEQAVIIGAIAQNLETQEKLDDVNARIASKQAEIDAKQDEITVISTDAEVLFSELSAINDEVSFEKYFTEEEYIQLDRFIKDDALSEESFVAQTADSYTDEDVGNKVVDKIVDISDANVSYVVHANNKGLYDIRNGIIKVDDLTANIVRAAIETKPDNSFIMTAYIANGAKGGRKFPKGCISITGNLSKITDNLSEDDVGMTVGSAVNVTVADGYMYFTLNTNEYERRAVAWDLLEYGQEILGKISQPAYTFSVDSANFLALDEFRVFKDKFKIGEKIYIAINEEQTLNPICIGAKINFDALNELSLEFGDGYTSSEAAFLMADLLEQSISMGKNAELSKYTYSAFMDSGASTKVKDFMSSALDVAKNEIMSSKDQAFVINDTGLRLRKWANETKTAYEPEQIWANNNSILMTKDDWNTAEMAIGKFYDDNLGQCWGVVAPNIVGTLLAGSNLVIESEKADYSGVAVFKMDGEGCFLNNAYLSVTDAQLKNEILLDPENGLMIGRYPLHKNDGSINDDNKLFYADTDGNLVLKGKIYAEGGEFTGKVTATSGYIGSPTEGWEIGSMAIYNGKPTLLSTEPGMYVGVDGISMGNTTNYVRADASGLLSANNVDLTGKINATSGAIGGCNIVNGNLQVSSANIANLSADKITSGTLDADKVNVINLNADNITAGDLSASRISGGTLNFNDITAKNLNADCITAGTVRADRIEGLDASKIVSGVLGQDRIPSISTNKLSVDYINGERAYWDDTSVVTGVSFSRYSETVRVMLSDGTTKSITFLTPDSGLNATSLRGKFLRGALS